MSVVDLEAVVNLRDVENGLRRMQLAGMDLRPVFRASEHAFRADMKQHQKERRGERGSWSRLATSTILHRKARTGKQGRKRSKPPKGTRLKILGNLVSAGRFNITSSRMKLISVIKWSGVHQRGGIAGRGARIPQREYYWASPRLLAIVHTKAIDHMAKAWKGRGK